jgi:hypothetical protein
MKILYEAILTAFKDNKDLFSDEHLQPPAFIDLYDSQPEIPDQFEFMCPAIFLDYSIAWEKNGTQRIGTLTLEVHVLTDATPSTANISVRLPEGMQKIDYYDTVVNVLEGIATEETSGLVLKSERPVSTDYFNYHVLTFDCTISRKVNDARRFVDGMIETINIDGKIKQRLIFEIE